LIISSPAPRPARAHQRGQGTPDGMPWAPGVRIVVPPRPAHRRLVPPP
jgi:hypothetical protein